MSNDLTRRSFVKWGTAAAGAATLAGFTGCAPSGQENAQKEGLSDTGDAPAKETGAWLSNTCVYNCSCGASRCVQKVYVEDGVPLKIRTDEDEEDSYALPQRRACARGRAQIANHLSAARIKYPMKRKNWSPDNPRGELRGKDEWERISWDEALDYVAAEIKKVHERYGPKGIYCGGPTPSTGLRTYNQTVCLLDAMGGAIHAEAGTVSFGAFSVADTHMLGGFGMGNAPHPLQLRTSELHILFGCNWTANMAGNTAWWLSNCRENGAKVIIIDPWLNQTAQALADDWIPILPGTDTAMILAICYEWIKNGTFDQDYLDAYTIGFDASHMPEGADPKDNFRDYVMGTYDGEPKTPEWAESICTVPANRIVALAETIAAVDKVNFFAAMSASKIPAGEQLVQSFYTMALMHGGIGTPGHYMSWSGIRSYMGGTVSNGNATSPELNPKNPLCPDGSPVYMYYPIPVFSKLQGADWENMEPSESWQSILDGEYGRDCWPEGKHKVDFHVMYFGGGRNYLNQQPNANAGIKAIRKMDFVWGDNPFFDPTRQYCDIVLPVAGFWEKGDVTYAEDQSTLFWNAHIMDPLYESRTEGWIAEELAKRLGVDPKVVNPQTDAERSYASVKGSTIMDGKTFQVSPLITLSQDEADSFGIEGAEPQEEGLISFTDFREKGYFKYPQEEGVFIPEPYQAFISDPEGSPLNTASGKFEIYCQTLAYMVNSVGYSQISPIGKYQGDPDQGAGAQTEEFPLLLWTPHTLRRAHSVNDNVASLREAFPQECFISAIDAQARGISNGDTVLMASPHGKVLRPAKVLPTLVPGAVALQDGSWLNIDEETGIDLGGCPNILQAPKASGGGSQSWTGTLVQVEKYNGPLTLEPDKNTPIVMPVGIEE